MCSHHHIVFQDFSECVEDSDGSGSESSGTGFGESLAIDPEARAMLGLSGRSSEQRLWEEWRRSAVGGDPQQPRSSGRAPDPPSPLDAVVSSPEIRSWMRKAGRYRSSRSLSSEEGVYSLSVEEACAPLLVVEEDIKREGASGDRGLVGLGSGGGGNNRAGQSSSTGGCSGISQTFR